MKFYLCMCNCSETKRGKCKGQKGPMWGKERNSVSLRVESKCVVRREVIGIRMFWLHAETPAPMPAAHSFTWHSWHCWFKQIDECDLLSKMVVITCCTQSRPTFKHLRVGIFLKLLILYQTLANSKLQILNARFMFSDLGSVSAAPILSRKDTIKSFQVGVKRRKTKVWNARKHFPC